MQKTLFIDRKRIREKLKTSHLIKETDNIIAQSRDLFYVSKTFKIKPTIISHKTRALVQRQYQLATKYVNLYSKTFPFFTETDIRNIKNYTNQILAQNNILNMKYSDHIEYSRAVDLMNTVYYSKILNQAILEKAKQIHFSTSLITGFSAAKRKEEREADLGFDVSIGDDNSLNPTQLQLEFVTMEDVKVCETCEDLDGNRYLINEHKPAIPDNTHPRCRCLYLLVTETDEDMFIY